MPYFTFATYADYREEWAIQADDIEDARRKIGRDPDGVWLNEAICLDAEPVESRDEFVTGDDDITPAVEEITHDLPWAWRAVRRDRIEHSLKQNTAAIAVEVHRHKLFDEFYEGLGERINGFVGIYDFCIAMAQALTEWEIQNGMETAYENHAVSWIEVVEDFVDDVLVNAMNTGQVPDFELIIKGLQVLLPWRTP